MSEVDLKVPNIGDFADVRVIEVHVKSGDTVALDDPLLTLESDKATVDIPASGAGTIVELLVNVGDTVSEGSSIAKLDADGATSPPKSEPSPKKSKADETPSEKTPAQPKPSKPETGAEPPRTQKRDIPAPTGFGGVHASPSVRIIARELDVDLTKINGTGAKGRITKDDVKRAVASGGEGASARGGGGIPQIPRQDFAKYGTIEEKPMSRIQRISGPHLHRSWLNVPHVTHFDEADITELEDYRKSLDTKAKDEGYRVTMLAFVLKASVSCLKEYAEFNASLGANNDTLIFKKYYNIGVAIDTPEGLVVPVIKDVDRKGIIELSKEIGETAERMRVGKIAPSDFQGGTFSISSLGGIGGTSFTPIVNAPEVAILGVARAFKKPVWNNDKFEPRLMLPLSVSYDHRAIDGALAARFTRRLCEYLSDMRQLVL